MTSTGGGDGSPQLQTQQEKGRHPNSNVYYGNNTLRSQLYVRCDPGQDRTPQNEAGLPLEKFNITFNKNNTVTYRQRQTFIFQRDRSVGTDNDTFLTVNAPLFTVASLLQYEYSILKEAVEFLLNDLGEDIFVNVSVHDIFWGYEDKFLKLVKDVLDTFNITSDLITGSFGYYMGRNGSDDGLYTVHTGTDDLSYFLVIDRWNNNMSLNYWSTSMANMINGTDGSLFPPFVTTDRILQMYDSNLIVGDSCKHFYRKLSHFAMTPRSVDMVYREDSSVLGIPTMKFVVDDDQFANASINPWNAGFCTPNTNFCIPPVFLTVAPWDTLAEVDDTIADMFKDQIETPLAIVTALHYACYGFGPLLALAPLVWILGRRMRARRQKQMVPASLNTTQQERVPLLNDQA
ncbi:hypothetical protein C0Q70_05866 [Pomacea canaliculata]|uniref:Scavenger receptor class B member 1 n=1 Tax=Pomacea canaliculata TaxID=400727 RepID=A0A2T7PME0_POMCA|nr:hypothetical protein C0Q70_05866 [Pomacea canaliculata]